MKRLLLTALLLVLAGCGSVPRAMDPQIREQLLNHVEAVKSAAERNDRPAAETALGELHRAIAEAQARGELLTETARALLTATERVAEDVRTMPLPEPPAPVTVTITPDPPPVVLPPPLDADQVERHRERVAEQAEKLEEMRYHWELNREQRQRVPEDRGRNNGNNNGNGNNED